MNATYTLKPSEERVRKRWLQLLIFYFLLSFSGYIFSCFCFDSRSGFVKFSFHNGFIYELNNFLALLLLYHCAYKKHGNILLTLNLVFFVLFIFLALFSSRSIEIIKAAGYSSFDFSLGAIMFGIEVWWFFLSLKLRKINQKIRTQLLASNDSYQKAKEILLSAQDLTDLQQKFNLVTQEFPDLISPLNQVFKEKKIAFK